MDESIARELYESHHVGIFRFALSMLGSEAAAEDVLHDTSLRLIKHEGLPYAPSRERSWRYAVARNLCMDDLRRRKRQAVQEFIEYNR